MNIDLPLTIERRAGRTPGIGIFLVSGPLTLPNILEFQAELWKGELPRISILDLSGVPYMDSAGMGAVMNYYTHCERQGARLVVAGVSKRVSALFKVTRVDTVIQVSASVAEVDA
jgi:anti-sigma B factor antagonist